MSSCIMDYSKSNKAGTPNVYYKTKVKLMKKLRRHLGVSRSTQEKNSTVVTSNLPPITFHPTHGENVRLLRDGAVACRREDSFCKGVAFSNRPIQINEKIYMKFVETSTNWSGVLRFGFTSADPSTLRGNLPKYACPDLTNRPGYWAKALADRYAGKDVVLFFYVTAKGDVHFGVNGKEKGVLFTGVNTRVPLWALFDIYGNTIAMEILGTYNSLRSITQTNLQRVRVVHNKLHQN